MIERGIFIPGNGKSLVKLRSSNGGYLLAASENKGPLTIFRLKGSHKTISLLPLDMSANILYKGGRT